MHADISSFKRMHFMKETQSKFELYIYRIENMKSSFLSCILAVIKHNEPLHLIPD